jgi:hypothetical protein
MEQILHFEDRSSESPLIERVWRSRSERGGLFTSIAAAQWEIIFTTLNGRTTAALRGSETRPTQAVCPPDGEWVAIRFRLGTYLPGLPLRALMDGQDFDLPVRSKGRIRWNADDWEIPSFDNAETFVHRLERAGAVARDPLVTAIVRGEVPNVSARSRQRRFRAVTGISYETFLQIERARRAAILLRAGRGILDTVAELRYFDQPHLTRALKRWLGMTPGEIARGGHQLSYLYKTE